MLSIETHGRNGFFFKKKIIKKKKCFFSAFLFSYLPEARLSPAVGMFAPWRALMKEPLRKKSEQEKFRPSRRFKEMSHQLTGFLALVPRPRREGVPLGQGRSPGGGPPAQGVSRAGRIKRIII